MTAPTRVQIVEEVIPFVNAASQAKEYVTSWDDYVGQSVLKNELDVYINEAMLRHEPLPHALLASPMPGVGKTTLARLIEKRMGGGLTMLVPPFTPETLYEAALSVPEMGFLFIDEFHLLKGRAAENLLHLLDEGVLYLDSGVHHLNNITVIAATTEKDALPETVLDRFYIKPHFDAYNLMDLVKITHNFCKPHNYDVKLSPEVMVAIAKACRATPRIAREFVSGARALQTAKGRLITPEELLAFKGITADGLTRQHQEYMKVMYQKFERIRAGETVYVASERNMCTLLREKPPALARLERYLLECGYIRGTPQGRQLTELGIQRVIRI
jgi:Holliday junction DNA helicase RuvB